MSYIIFENPGTFDLRLIKTFGVNVKPNSKNAIGYFGTGLKYAAAIVLRNGGEFRIQDGHGRDWALHDYEQDIRGKKFGLIKMHDEQGNLHELPFTTELGKNWMPWHAYRELYSNALDEGGKRYESVDVSEPKKNVVRFIIKSDPLLEVYYNHGDYFLDPSKLSLVQSTDYLDVYDEPTKSFYFNGIQVYRSDATYRYTYNAKKGITLTEDRNNPYDFQRNEMIKDFWAQCENKQQCEKFILMDSTFQDGKLDFGATFLSEVMFKMVDELMSRRFDKVPLSMRKNVQARRSENDKFNPISITPVQQKMLERGIEILAKFDYKINDYKLITCNLGQSLMGMADNGTIYISKVAFDKGMKQVVATLLEEYIHLEYLVHDCSRAMQDILFDKIVNMMEEKLGEPI